MYFGCSDLPRLFTSLSLNMKDLVRSAACSDVATTLRPRFGRVWAGFWSSCGRAGGCVRYSKGEVSSCKVKAVLSPQLGMEAQCERGNGITADGITAVN